MSKRLVIVVSIMILMMCCEDTVFVSSVPSYPVHLDIEIAAQFPHFVTTNTGQSMTFTKKRYDTEALGFAGIGVFIGMDEQYHAFDLGCPVCLLKDKPCKIDGWICVCENCGENYDLTFGICNPTKGISHEALRLYSTSYNGVKLFVR